MKKPITIGVLGCGYWGPLLVRAIKGLPYCRLKAVCDPDIARVKHVCASYSDLEGITVPEQLFTSCDVDAVVIATPVKSHYPLAKASLLAGKHTFIEKPMATSSPRVRGIDRHRRAQGSGFNGRSHIPVFRSRTEKIVEIVQAGDLGEIRYINSRR